MSVTACQEKEKMLDVKARVFALADQQLPLLARELGPAEFPRTLDKEGNLVKSDVGWWCSGFYPGSLWMTYEQTGNPKVLELAKDFTSRMEELLNRKTDHDIGFQLNCSLGNAYRITGDDYYTIYMEIGARRLAARYDPKVKCIRSWGDDSDPTYRVIIDNMMNLELVLNVAELEHIFEFQDYCLDHADRTMENHFRPDGSTYHLVEYDQKTGDVIRKKTVQGYSDESMWARGEAWALYGYTMVYRKLQEGRYLSQAKKIANLLLDRLPADGIPYWDFDCPDIPDTYKDASAAAIMSSAFIQLANLTGEKKYYNMAMTQLRTLASEEYLSKPGENHGFLLKHCVGNLPGKSEVDVPLTYADYYFLEALRQIKN